MRDGGPAFPVATVGANRPTIDRPGMTLRDYFAAAALTGMYLADEMVREHVNPGARLTTAEEFARSAYLQADALLAARDAKGGA